MKPKDHTEQLVFCSFVFLNRKYDGLIRQFIFYFYLPDIAFSINIWASFNF